MTPSVCHSADQSPRRRKAASGRSSLSASASWALHRVGTDNDVIHPLGMAGGEVARKPPPARIPPGGHAVDPLGIENRDKVGRHPRGDVGVRVVRGVTGSMPERIDIDDTPIPGERR